MIHKPSDTSISQADYANGIGYYTDVTRIANLLSVPEFDDSSYPTEAHVGELHKRFMATCISGKRIP